MCAKTTLTGSGRTFANVARVCLALNAQRLFRKMARTAFLIISFQRRQNTETRYTEADKTERVYEK